MGLLDSNYINKALIEKKTDTKPPVQPTPQVQNTQENTSVSTPSTGLFKTADVEGIKAAAKAGIPYKEYIASKGGSTPAPGTKSISEGVNERFRSLLSASVSAAPISTEEQISRFGVPVGSQEYYQKKIDHPYASFLPMQLGAAVGMEFPNIEDWDKMSRNNQAAYIVDATTFAAAKMVTSLPKEIVKAPMRFFTSVGSAWKKAFTGEIKGGVLGSTEEFKNKISQGDFKGAMSVLGESAGKAMQSAAEEKPLTLPWLGEIPTYWKSYDEARKAGMGPGLASITTAGLAAGDIAMSASLAEGLYAATKPRSSLGVGETIKDVRPIEMTIKNEQGSLSFSGVKKGASTSEYYSLPSSVAEKFKGSTRDTFLKVTPADSMSTEVSIVQVRSGKIPQAVDYVKSKFGAPDKSYIGDFGREVKVESQVIPIASKGMGAETKLLGGETIPKNQTIVPIPTAPLKGMENKAITPEQFNNLDTISNVNGIPPAIKDAVVKSVTGKSVVGELTQAEYVNTAKTLAAFNEASKYVSELPVANIAAQYISPQRRWMRTYEEKSGLPIYSEVYVPMEDATRVRNVFETSYKNQAREIYGEYAKPKFAEERRLIKSYLEGDTGAVTKNTTLSESVKTDLINIADQMRPLYDKLGQLFNVPMEIFLKDYQPHVADIGGVFQLYKKGTHLPEGTSAFFKEKRSGSLSPMVDDSLSLFDIYVHAGANKAFLDPVLKRVTEFNKEIPASLQDSVTSYVQEKLGYGGKLEEFLDKAATNFNKKFGTNLPPDTARQMTSLAMDTVYAGGLSSPASVIRNAFQYDLLVYPRVGPGFYKEAAIKSLTKEGIREVRDAGFLVEGGAPFGEEIAAQVGPLGKARATYQAGTQAIVAPFSAADTITRVRTYWQVKYQFDDAIAKYNAGKMSWTKVEDNLKFRSLSPVDRNIIRQRLVSGDIKGAFEHLVRDVLDDTLFPYRRGSGPRITYGLEGKLGTTFMQWPIEAAHTLGRWAKNGEWDNIVRLWGASSAIHRTLQTTFGWDFSKSLYGGPFANISYSPFVKSAINLIDGFQAAFQKNDQQLEDNKSELVRTLQSLGVPAGVEARYVRNFFKSYNAGPIGPNGNYPVYDDSGRLRYYGTFRDIWWQMFGFPTATSEAQKKTQKEMVNAKFDYSQSKKEVLKLYQQEKYDEANKIIQDKNISLSPSDFDQYYIPLTERTLESLPASIKYQFINKVYNPKDPF